MTSAASFQQKNFNLEKKIYFWWFVTFYYLKKAPKKQNNSKFIKEHEVLSNWTIEGARHQKNKNWWIQHKSAFLMNTWDLKYQQKSKSPEQNYFALFAMRYPVGVLPVLKLEALCLIAVFKVRLEWSHEPKQFDVISKLIWRLITRIKVNWEILSNFVAFLNNLNFIYLC